MSAETSQNVQLQTAIAALDAVKVAARTISKDDIDVTNVDAYGPELRDLANEARVAIRPLIGERVCFGVVLNHVYAVRPGETPPHQKVVMPSRFPALHPIRGVMTGLQNANTLRGKFPQPRFSLRVAPHIRRPDADWQEFYDSRGLAEAYRHPAGMIRYAGRSVVGNSALIPIINIDFRTMQITKTPRASQHVVNQY